MEIEEEKLNPNIEDSKTEETQNNESNVVQEITEESVLSFLRDRGRDVSSIDDLFNVPEPEKIIETKEVNPWEDVLDEEDRAYLEYKKETGRSRAEFEALQKNLDDISPLEFAREQVIKESGIKLSKEQIDEYLENKLGISDINDLTTSDLIELSKYGKPVKDSRIEEQNKFRKPLEKKHTEEPKNNKFDDEFVQLANGTFMKKSDFEIAQQNQAKHNEMLKEAVNSVTATSFKVMVEENGEQRELAYSYDYSDNDRGSAMSIVSDLEKFVQENYQTENGFDYPKFLEDSFWLSRRNRENVMASIVNKARAEAIEETLKARGNVNFKDNHKGLGSNSKYQTKVVDINDF